jgi:UDP-glucose 4-epimerase
MKADTVDRFYNVGTGRRTSIKELAELILRITGSNLDIQYEPTGQTFVKNRIGSPDRARREIGFEAQVPLETGLRKLIAWRNGHKEDVARRRARAAQ